MQNPQNAGGPEVVRHVVEQLSTGQSIARLQSPAPLGAMAAQSLGVFIAGVINCSRGWLVLML